MASGGFSGRRGWCRWLGAALGLVVLVAAGNASAQGSFDDMAGVDLDRKIERLRQEVTAGGYTFEVGKNPAALRPLKDLAGLVEPPGWRKRAVFETLESYTADLPTAFDWRENGVTTPVRDQGSCGACWAFATVAPLEMLIKRDCGKTVDLSEQYLLSCNEFYWGCNGGWFAHDYHLSYVPATETEPGAVMESQLPYQAVQAPCNGPYEHPYRIDFWTFVAAGSSVPSVSAIKQAIQTYGPVAAAVCTGPMFQTYTGGIFNYNESCSGLVNHAVVLVGWNDDLGPDNGYWILKNSWGEGWGEGGYMRIRYGISNVGYAANYVMISDCGPPTEVLNCAESIPVTLGVPVSGDNSLGMTNGVSRYGCSTQFLDGPEVVYEISLQNTGDLVAQLTDVAPGADPDVLILRSCDQGDCAAYGDNTATLPKAGPGTYTIVVDSAKGAEGGYTLTVSQSLQGIDLKGEWVSIDSNDGKIVDTVFRVSNVGTVKAGAFKVAYYLSSTPQPAGKAVKTLNLKSLAAGASQDFTTSLRWSASQSGKYLVAHVDYLNTVTEVNENNNVAAVVIP